MKGDRTGEVLFPGNLNLSGKSLNILWMIRTRPFIGLGGGFKYFLFSPRTLGKMNPF